MIAILIVATYFGLGGILTRLSAKRFYKNAVNAGYRGEIDTFVLYLQALGMLACWPIYLACFGIKAILGTVITFGDTPYGNQLRKADLDERERAIRDMERELGIGRDR